MIDERAATLSRFARERWRLVAVLALGAGLLHATSEVLGGDSLEGIVMPSVLWIVETPLQVLVLSLTYDATLARRLSPTVALLVSVVVAVAMGTLLALSFVFVFQDVVGLDDAHDPPGHLSHSLVAALGAVSGVLFAGVWGLAIVSPYTTARDQLRLLDAQQLRFEADRLRVSAELARLRSQLEPHFVLNTLNAIAGLVSQRPSEARRLLGCLGDLLRDALDDEHELQTLDCEVTWLRRYADILQARHGDALRFDWDIPPAASGVLLPRLLLQPLVENAVQHGALCRTSGGRVAVSASVETSDGGARLVCSVRDNGPGLPPGEPRHGALGIDSVRRRLELQCPGAALRFESTGDGTLAIVEVPLPEAA